MSASARSSTDVGCPTALTVIRVGRADLHVAACAACTARYDEVAQLAANGSTLDTPLTCDAIRALIDEAGAAAAPDAHGLVPIFLHVPKCPACMRALGDAAFQSEIAHARADTQLTARPGRFDPGQLLGRFAITGKLGEGGMGAVLAAHDPDLDRKVAIKIVHERRSHGRRGEQAELRLVREAQAIARIRHPNVITVYEVGKLDDLVFIAMDLIDGGTLRGWLAGRSRPWRDVLAAFARAGAGLAAAHAAGLVHRDFKPDNVLVGKDGGIFVTDFGLVGADRADQDPLAAPDAKTYLMPLPIAAVADASLTRSGELMGTPQYMSPEQHECRPTDARTDQFSFCVALWEALYGALPFQGKAYHERVYNVCHGVIVPPPKDTRVPGWIRPVLERGMAPRPDDRHPSIAVLLDRLQPPTRAWRRPVIAAAVGAVAIATGVSLAVVTHHPPAPVAQLCTGASEQVAAIWNDGTRAAIKHAFAATGRGYAGETFERVAPMVSDYLAGGAAMQTESCRAARVFGSESQDMLDRRAACLDRRYQAVQTLVQLWRAPDDDIVANAIGAVRLLPPISDCAAGALSGTSARLVDPAQQRALAVLETRFASASALLGAGKYREGIAIASEVNAAAVQLGFAPFVAESALVLGELQWRAGDMKASVGSLEAAFDAAEAADDSRAKVLTATELTYVVGTEQQDLDGAQRWARRARAALSKLGGDPALEAKLLRNLGTTLFKAERYDEALADHQQAAAIRERLFGPASLEVAESLRGVGTVLVGMGKPADAIPELERALAIATRAYGDQHPELADYLNNLGGAHAAAGDTVAARAAYERALALREQALGSRHVMLADVLVNLGNLDCERGACDKAIASYERAATLEETTYGASYPGLAMTLADLGYARGQLKQYDAAMTALRRAIAIQRAAHGGNLAFPLTVAGQTAFAQAQALPASARAAAVALAREGLADLEEAGADRDATAEIEDWLASHR